MTADKTDLHLARLLYQSSTESIRASLPDLGQSLHTAAIDLERDLTLERVDDFLARLQGAESALTHLRKALFAEDGT